jgi:hypothetical protein
MEYSSMTDPTLHQTLTAFIERHRTADNSAEVDALLARIGEGDGWQPIETALRDGSILLLANKYYQHTGVYLNEDVGWCVLENDDEITPQPTHWRPLPAAPLTRGPG